MNPNPRSIHAQTQAGTIADLSARVAELERNVARKNTALEELRRYIRHWQDDRACQIPPTEQTLLDALSLIEAALK
jgi:uncharacterized coiled-coil protein SlyX